MKTTVDLQDSSKKTWNEPDLVLIEKEIIEGGTSAKSDGGGASTSS